MHKKINLLRNTIVKHWTGTRWILTILLLFALGMILQTVLFFDTHLDEIGLRVINSRWQLDGYTVSSLFPQCFSAQGLSIPLSWVPNRFFDELVFGQITQLNQFRYYGISFFICLVSLLIYYVKINFPEEKSTLVLLVIAVLFSGTIPFASSILRYESVIILHLVGMMVLAHANRFTNLRIFLFLLLILNFFPFHPKTVLFAPYLLFLSFRMVADERRWLIGGLISAFLLFCFAQSLHYYIFALQCPESTNVTKTLGRLGVSPTLLFSDPLLFLKQLGESAVHTARYYNKLVYKGEYTQNWLPLNPEAAGVWINGILRLAFLTLLFYAFWVPIRILRQSKDKKVMVTNLNWVSAFLFLITLFGIWLINSDKGHYDSSFAFTLLLILFLLGLKLESGQRRKKIIKVCLWIFIPSLICSIWGDMAYLRKSILAPPDSTRLLAHVHIDHERLNKAIHTTAAKCSLGRPEKYSRLIIDERTYLAFKQSKQPIVLRYIDWGFYQDPEAFPKSLDLLKRYQVPGIITHCQSLQASVLKPLGAAIVEGEDNLCCVSTESLQELYRQRP